MDEKILEEIENSLSYELDLDIEVALDLKEFLDDSSSMYHAANNLAFELLSEGYEEIGLTEKWNLTEGGKYFVDVNDSTIIAFVVGEKNKGFRIVGAHTDSPGFKIKSNPVIKKDGYIQLNTEVYGGPLLYTWFDRPLSIAGRVFLKGESSHKPNVELLKLDYDLLTIPSLAIHMMSMDERNKFSVNPQTHSLPIIGLDEEFDLDELIASELNVEKSEILSHDLFLYSREEALIMGINADFIQSGKIDNLAMVHSGYNALINSEKSEYTQVLACFDNEEIGSATMQGAASAMFRDILKKISISLGNNEEEFINQIYDSYMISADQAHAIHPNYSGKADPTNQPKMNMGPVIKDSARKSYATDAFGRAVLIDIAKVNNIPLQIFHNRSDLRGGSTIGAIIETNTGIRNIDIGNPMLAMHSIREIAGIKDHVYMIDLMKDFYESR